jgi:O-antigen/teichoic acid export membrane protein
MREAIKEVKVVAVNTVWMLTAQLLRVTLQGVYFVVVARALGAEAFGSFVSVLALVGILVPFAGLGFGSLIVKNVAQDRNAMQSSCGNMLFMVGVSGSALVLLALLLKPFFIAGEISVWVLFAVALSDLILTKVVFASGLAFQAVERLSKTSVIFVSLFATRTLAALLMLRFVPNPTVLTWSIFYGAGTVVTALLAMFFAYRSFGRPCLDLSRLREELAEGFFFSASMSGQVINNNMDKIMLGRMATLSATGIYGAAYRLIDVSMVPIRALLQATYARFFKYGKHGIQGSLKMGARLAPIAGVFGFVAMICIYLAAPVVPYVLGDEYAASVAALRWLAPIPFFKSLHFVASDTLSGASLQKLRSSVIFVAAGFNVVLNVWLIPLYSWRGAAWSSLAADGLLMVGLWLIVLRHYRKSRA